MNTITLNDCLLAYHGDASMLLCPLTTFLCSHSVPEGTRHAIRQWVEGLDAANTCVVCGSLTSDERFALQLLLERGIPVVLALAQAIPPRISDLRIDGMALTAILEGRMVVISPVVDAALTDPSAKTSAARNNLMISIAEQVVVGYMTANGNLARQLLGRRNVEILKPDGQPRQPETDEQRIRYNQTQMGWAIYHKLKEEALSSLQMRQLLDQYLQLKSIERPSLLHSQILVQVVSRYAQLPDFNFTAFLRLWDPLTLRPEDWRAVKLGDHWMPALAERVMARLFRALPNRFRPVINPNEEFDPRLAHFFVDQALARPTRKPNERLLQRALSLAYYEHDSVAIQKYRQLIDDLKK